MSFLKNLFSSSPAKRDDKYLAFHVKCDRCGETLDARVDLDNDLSLNDAATLIFLARCCWEATCVFNRSRWN